MRRIEQVNEMLKGKLASLISRELPLDNGLVTVTFVDCSPDLKNAKIGVSVLPHNISKNIIKNLAKHNFVFSQILKKETRLHHIPKFRWIIDETEEKAAGLEKILKKIEKEGEKNE